MLGSKFIRWSALAAVLAGVSGAAVTIMGQTQPPVPAWISITSLITSLIALTGIYQYQKEVDEGQGAAGYYLAMAGSVLLNLNILIEVTGIIYALGLVLLALTSLRAGRDPKWIPLMWIVSPLVGFSGVILGSLEILFVIGGATFGSGFIGFAYVLWASDE